MPVLATNELYLLQHFKGQVIETAAPVFDPETATLMDFRVPQPDFTAFVYVMPFSATKALVEYTVFSEQLLQPADYVEALQRYIQQNIGQPYIVKEEEFGVIPMTNHRFPEREGNIIYIGSAGGQTKASSGYTFQFIQKQCDALLAALLAHGDPLAAKTSTPARFRFYDSVLLRVLARRSFPGQLLFTQLFQHNQLRDVLQFLDNETSIFQDLRIITVLPKRIFLKAAWEQAFCRSGL